MENKEKDKIAAPTLKVTIVSDIRITPENQAHIDLHDYFSRGKIVDKHFNLFSTSSVSDNENAINIYDDPIPSTSGKCNLKQNNKMIKIEQEIQNTETNYDIMQLCNKNLDPTEKILDCEKNTEKVKEQKYYKCDVTTNLTTEFSQNANTPKNKTDEDKIDACDIIINNQSIETNNETEESNAIMGEGIDISINVNDSVLVRYYEKKAWVYYVGFVENLDIIIKQEIKYTIRFLKTIKKPKP